MSEPTRDSAPPPAEDPLSDELASTLEQGRRDLDRVRREVGKVIVGHGDTLEGLLVALLAGGNVLVEGVPGLGKTLLVRTLAGSLGLEFSRIQCTPDLMPADVLGTRILVEEPDGSRRFEFQPGPVFTNVLLADEVNRATPKTQSALLEAMQERTVTVAGEPRALEEPFFVLATQNPIEMEGTFPLPEAQVDRFLFKLQVTLPGEDDLREIVQRTTGADEARVEPVMGRDAILALRRAVRQVPVPEPVLQYALRLVIATHPGREGAPEEITRYVRWGSSPRGAQALVLAARVRAGIDGRPNASFEDVRWAARHGLRHRMVPSFEGVAEGIEGDALVDALLRETEVAEGLGQDLADAGT